MLTVHHLGVSQSERIIWLCEELAIPYELVIYDRDPVTRLAPAAYKALHPMGIAPVITDGGLVLGESGAIIDYIIGRYGAGRLTVGADDPAFADYLFWFHFANGTLMPSAMTAVIATMLGAGSDNPVVHSLSDRYERSYALIEARLGEVDYLAGAAFTAADIMTVFALTTMRVFAPRDLGPYPDIAAYLGRIGARPAYQRAMAKGDPGMTPMLS
ncbi:glutathione S-transferase [Sphingobium sp. AN558]|uniref:glutathione S-transferase family protein n=1 Tax=Sphingobium sp. AN558 TaxID=3133442 RepID=UPI0030C50111